MVLIDAARLLTAPPGSLAYQLTLAAIAAVLFGLAQVEGRRTRSSRATRWSLAAGGILALRLGLLALATLAWQQLVDPAWLPPLEGFASLAGVVALTWAFLVPAPHRSGDLALLAVLAAALVVLAVELIAPPGAGPMLPDGRLWADAAWPLAGLALAGAAVVTLVLRRPLGWELALVAFGLLTAGAALQLVLGVAAGTPDSLVRLSEWAAYPFAAVAAARLLALEPTAPALAEPASLPAVGTAALSSPLEGVADMASLASARSQDELARRAVRALAHTLRVELCLMLTAADPAGQFAVAAGYDLIQERHLPGWPLDARDCPAISQALTQRRWALLPAGGTTPDLNNLQFHLGLAAVGPGLLLPLAAGDEMHGGLLLLSPYAPRQWTTADRQAVEVVAGHLAQRFTQLQGARRPAAPPAAPVAQTAPPPAEGAAVPLGGPTIGAALSKADDIPGLEELAGELQLALQELAETRAALNAGRTAVATPSAPPAAAGSEAVVALAQELRQPLSSVLGYTELLLGDSVGRLGAAQRQFVERVHAGVERIKSLLSDVVQVTALQAGEMTLTPTPVDLLRCVEQAVAQAGPTLREKDLALRMAFPDEAPALLGDEQAVVQILVHLIANAAGASPEGSELGLAARVVEGEPAGYLLMAVSDSGVGVPSEDLGRAFEPVFRSEHSPIPGLGESGAGLALVKALSEELSGRVWIESQPGQGSTLSVLLPLAATEPAVRPG